MTPQERLKLYELALIDYEASLTGDDIVISKLFTYHGFCHYYKYAHKVRLYGDLFKDVLPELYVQKPYDDIIIWFELGEIQPRIECLKKAIELTKSKL